MSGEQSLAHLLGRLDAVRARVRALVERRRAGDPDPDDRFRGLYVTDEQLERLLATAADHGAAVLDDERAAAELARLEAWADERESEGVDLRLRRLARSVGLVPLDVDILLVALAPDLDPRLEKAYGYLHDDVTRRRASIGLALELCGVALHDGRARRRFDPSAPLVSAGLLLVEDADRPVLTRSLRVPDRVIDHLLGDDTPDAAAAALLVDAARQPVGDPSPLRRAVAAGSRLVYVRDRVGAAALTYAVNALEAAGVAALAADLDRLPPDEPAAQDALANLVREARLQGAGLVLGPVETLADRSVAAVRRLAESDVLVVFLGMCTWDPSWASQPPLVLDAPAIGAPLDPELPFRLTPEQTRRAWQAARQQATALDAEVDLSLLAAGARAQNAGGLERLALRIAPDVGWGDLVLPAGVLVQLRELAERVRFRDRVHGQWRLGRGSSKGGGVTALFAGDSGTGKTMSAEVVAAALGLDLYVVDLATVIDKYIGETEKNLDRIFREADRVNGVLLFDEADAVFGKRSEVQDAHDRYANVEVAYLLQRMERFDGVAILTTNLRANLDEAFLRRLDVVIEFPVPDADARRMLWERHLPPSVPRSADIDLDFMARAFELSGGNIRNVTLAAAFFAATDDRPVAMADLIRATEREYRKLGRLCVEAEFGPYHPLLRGGPRAHP